MEHRRSACREHNCSKLSHKPCCDLVDDDFRQDLEALDFSIPCFFLLVILFPSILDCKFEQRLRVRRSLGQGSFSDKEDVSAVFRDEAKEAIVQSKERPRIGFSVRHWRFEWRQSVRWWYVAIWGLVGRKIGRENPCAVAEGLAVDRFEEERLDDRFSNDLFGFMYQMERREGLESGREFVEIRLMRF